VRAVHGVCFASGPLSCHGWLCFLSCCVADVCAYREFDTFPPKSSRTPLYLSAGNELHWKAPTVDNVAPSSYVLECVPHEHAVAVARMRMCGLWLLPMCWGPSPSQSCCCSYVYDPLNPTPACAGATFHRTPRRAWLCHVPNSHTYAGCVVLCYVVLCCVVLCCVGAS